MRAILIEREASEQVTEPADGGLVGRNGPAQIHIGKFPQHRRLLQSLFHDWIGQVEPPLQKVRQQQNRQTHWPASVARLGVGAAPVRATIFSVFSSPGSANLNFVMRHGSAEPGLAHLDCVESRTPKERTYFKPYTSISPCGLGTVKSSCPVEMYTFPLATIGELNLIPNPAASPEFMLLSYNSLPPKLVAS